MENEKVLDSIAEGSALLAEFVGNEVENYKTLSGNYLLCVKDGLAHIPINSSNYPEFDYKNNWNALMKVINRISDHIYEETEEDNGLEKRIIKDRAYPRTFGMISQEGKYMFRFNRQVLFEGDTLIEAAFSACVDFVTWIKSCGGAIESKTSHETDL